LLFFLLIK